jgi:hypothetical protein
MWCEGGRSVTILSQGFNKGVTITVKPSGTTSDTRTGEAGAEETESRKELESKDSYACVKGYREERGNGRGRGKKARGNLQRGHPQFSCSH